MARTRSLFICLFTFSFFALSGSLTSLAVAAPAAAASAAYRVDVTQEPYNAVGDGISGDRAAIQRALDYVTHHGGGTVLLPAGKTFLSGSLTIGSNTTLEIDGTLLQSQNPADYSYTTIPGYTAPGTGSCRGTSCLYNSSFNHNLPLLYSGQQHNVQIVGSGTVQMTQGSSDANTIYLTPVGFYRVSHYKLAGLHILGSSVYNLSLFTTDHGLVKDLTITAAAGPQDGYMAQSDGVSLMNSQYIRITGNTIRNGDDAMYVWSSYADSRAYPDPLNGIQWWSSDDPQASTHIEFDHNYIAHTPGMSVGFIPWGTGAPDPRTVEISDVSIHNNDLTSDWHAVGCWCNNPNYGELRTWNPYVDNDQSAIKNITFANNTYSAPTPQQVFTATNLKTDYGAMGSGAILNGNFENMGTAWWSTEGDSGATNASQARVLRNPQARAALRDMDGWVGYIQPKGARGSAALYQGLGLFGSNPSPAGEIVPPSTQYDYHRGTYVMDADVVTGRDPVRLYAYDTCTKQVLAEKYVTATKVKHEELDFTLANDCDDVQVGVDRGDDHADNVWAMVDNVAVTSSPGDDTTPPTVSTTAPLSGATSVDTASAPTVTFSEPVEESSVQMTLTDAAGQAVDGTTSYDSQSLTETFTPRQPLANETTYTATASATDVSGNAMPSAYSWSFTTVSLTPVPGDTVWPNTAVPDSITNIDGRALNLGLKFSADKDGQVVGIQFYKGPDNTGTHTGTLWSADGQKLATGTFTDESTTGWQTLIFANPAPITANTTYVVSYYAPQGSFSTSSLPAGGVDNPPLHVPAGAGLYLYGDDGFPTNSIGSNYWVQPIFTD